MFAIPWSFEFNDFTPECNNLNPNQTTLQSPNPFPNIEPNNFVTQFVVLFSLFNKVESLPSLQQWKYQSVFLTLTWVIQLLHAKKKHKALLRLKQLFPTTYFHCKYLLDAPFTVYVSYLKNKVSALVEIVWLFESTSIFSNIFCSFFAIYAAFGGIQRWFRVFDGSVFQFFAQNCWSFREHPRGNIFR